eukprot:2884136-Alexandrium_andersonii.AAC.1
MTPVASLFTQLRTSAAELEGGEFRVQGALLNAIMDAVQQLASPSASVAPTTPTSAPAMPMTDPPSSGRPLWADTVDSEMSDVPDSAASFSDGGPTDTELRKYYRRFISTPKSAQHKKL